MILCTLTSNYNANYAQYIWNIHLLFFFSSNRIKTTRFQKQSITTKRHFMFIFKYTCTYCNRYNYMYSARSGYHDTHRSRQHIFFSGSYWNKTTLFQILDSHIKDVNVIRRFYIILYIYLNYKTKICERLARIQF